MCIWGMTNMSHSPYCIKRIENDIWTGVADCTWWRHQMETFSALLALCAGNSPVTAQWPVTRSFDVFFDLRPNKLLSKQSRGWWFETPSRSLWRHCNDKRSRECPFVFISRSCDSTLISFFIIWRNSLLIDAQPDGLGTSSACRTCPV